MHSFFTVLSQIRTRYSIRLLAASTLLIGVGGAIALEAVPGSGAGSAILAAIQLRRGPGPEAQVAAVAAAPNTIEDNFQRPNQAGWGTTTNDAGITNVAWGMDGAAATPAVNVTNNKGLYVYPGATNVVGVAAAGPGAFNGGDAYAQFYVTAVGHVTPYISQNACPDKSCYYGARLHTSQGVLEIAKRAQNSTSILATTPFVALPNTSYRIRLNVTPGSPTTLRAKIWKSTDVEPGWMLTATMVQPLAPNRVGAGGSWDKVGVWESIRYSCFTFSATGSARACKAATPGTIPTATPTKPPATATGVPATPTRVPPTATATTPPPTATKVPPIPTPPSGGIPELLFGLGSQPDAAMDSVLNQEAPLGMYTSWYNGPSDLDWMQWWKDSGFIRRNIYDTGRAAHVITWTDLPETGTPCGRPYPISDGINADMVRLAKIWAGTAHDPPLYVTLFTEFQTFPCEDNQWKGSEAYYTKLKQKMIEIRDIFHQYAPNSKVSIGWGGWQMRWDNPADGEGASLIPHFYDVMSQMDFQSVQAMHDSGNVNDVRNMTRELGQFGPVMLAHYKPMSGNDATFLADVSAMMTDSYLNEVTGYGLFAWSFMDTNNIDGPEEAQQYQIVKNGVLRYGRFP